MIDVPVEVKDALREGTYKKNYRFVVLNEDGTESEIGTIDNDNLVSESVSIDERMCSGDTLKFGLCEGSSLEFQYFGKPNITGKRVQAFVDVQYREDPYETIGELNSSGAHYRYDVAEAGDYRIYINADQVSNVATSSSVSVSHNGPTTYYDMVVKPDGHGEVLLPGLTTIDKIYLWAKPWKYAESTVQIDRGSYYSIPMGFFDVKKCSRQASTGIIKATCYNKLQSEYLDAKANETVAELVAQGEYGYTDQISMYTLLKTLLEGYGIEEVTYGYEKLPIDYSRSYNYDSIALTYSDGTPYGANLYLYLLSFPMVLNSEDFYKFYLYTQEIYNRARNYVWWSYRNNYVKINNVIYTIDQVAQGNWGFSSSLAGRVYLRKKVDINTFFFGVNGGIPDAWTDTYSKCYSIDVRIPVYATTGTRAPTIDPTIWDNYFNQKWGSDFVFLDAYKQDLSDAEKMRITTSEIESIQDVTLRELQTAVYETSCQFGQLSREADLFSGVELNHSRLYPADSLYPATDLYPSGAAASGFRSMYSKLWADEGNVHKWKYLIITYKGLDGEGNEQDYTLQRTVNNDGTDNYNCSDNWLFRNLVWTAEQIGAYADAMVAKMQDVTWFPFEMWCAGLPYIETGDEIEIPLGEHSYTSYVLQRQLKGIQNLQDTYINGTLDIF